MITLISGPYNGRQIEDSGTVVIRMCIYDPAPVKGAKVGEARYEPSEDRSVAFWEGNTWLGTLEEIIDAGPDLPDLPGDEWKK